MHPMRMIIIKVKLYYIILLIIILQKEDRHIMINKII